MKKLCVWIIIMIFTCELQAQMANTLSAQEKKEGWKLLFDGKSLKGWHTYNVKGIGAAWRIDQEAMVLFVPNRAGNKAKDGGDIVTDEVFTGNFELKIDWKITRLANSGVFLFVTESPTYKNMYDTGLEIQVTDNTIFGEGPENKHRAGDLFDLVNSRTRQPKTVGEWNQMYIVVNKGLLNVFLNGVQIHEIRLSSQEWKGALAKSGLKNAPVSQGNYTGRIGLQDWGSQVWYRNIKIRPL